jgi:hypothetical protein
MDKIDKILEDLYRIDPALKKHEDAVRAILADLYNTKPNIIADANFVKTLRMILLDKAVNSQSVASRPMFIPMPNKYAFSLIAIAFFIIMPAIFILRSGPSSSVSTVASVRSLERNAFGPLAMEMVGGRGGGGVGLAAPMVATSDSAIQQKIASAPVGRGGGGGGMGVGTMIYPAPDFYQIKYKYDGGELQLNSEGPVYKKRTDNISAVSILSTFKNFPISKIRKPQLTSVVITEDRDFGYNIDLALKVGIITFSQNYERWPSMDGCMEGDCSRYLLKPSNIPSNQEIINISDAFLREYGINMTGYGPGELNNVWRNSIQVPQTDNPENVSYLPPEIPVIYPLIIDGMRVYDEWGNVIGMSVSVNANLKRVAYASNILIGGFDKSNYALETDSRKIIELAEKGGVDGEAYYMMNNGSGSPKTVNVKIGKPSVGLMQYYIYKPYKNPEMLFVPALIFPVVNISDSSVYNKENIVIPLATEVLQQIEDRFQPGPKPLPMPMEGVVNPSVTVPEGSTLERK